MTRRIFLSILAVALAVTLTSFVIIMGALYGYFSGDNPGERPGDAFRLYTGVYPLIFATVGTIIANLIRLPRAGEE